jgi:hypothetical protein
MVVRQVVLAVLLLGAADVVPANKGCCSSSDSATLAAGAVCGPLGHASCSSGLVCAYTCDNDGGSSEREICTRTCATDSDCTSLGSGFRCGACQGSKICSK